MKFVVLLLIGALIGSLVVGAPFYILLILFLGVCVISIICNTHDIFAHSAKLIVLFVVVVSVFIMPAYGIVTSRYGDLSMQDRARILELGAPLVLFLSVLWYITKPLSRVKKVFDYSPMIFSDKMMAVIFLSVFPISIFSYMVGLGRMGAAAVVLPFHLTGILVFFQTKLVPALFVIYVENKILNKRKVKSVFYICYIVWSFFMSLVLLSKGIFISNLIPLLILLFLYYRPNRKTIIKSLIPITLCFFFMYPVIGIMRLVQEDRKSMDFSSIIKIAYEDDESEEQSRNDNFFLRPLNRVFKTGAHYYHDYDIMKKDYFFDFSRMPIIMSMGGSARYQTVIIEGYTEGANHSSGTTGIMDPILVGGKGLMYITLFFIMLLAAFVDRLFQKRQYSIYAILIFLVFDLICNHNVSLIFEYTNLLVTLLSVYLAYFFNFRNKSKGVVLSNVK